MAAKSGKIDREKQKHARYSLLALMQSRRERGLQKRYRNTLQVDTHSSRILPKDERYLFVYTFPGAYLCTQPTVQPASISR